MRCTSWSSKPLLARFLRAGLLLAVFPFVVLPGAGTVGWSQTLSPSVPDLQPIPGAPDITADDIPDLTTAPPLAVDSIVLLVQLGVYPLSEGFRAEPNRPITEAEVASMLVDLYAPGFSGEFPASREAAVSYLRVLTGGALSEDGARITTGTVFLEMAEAVLLIGQREVAALRNSLGERYPAFAAGNYDAPLTRAGASLLVAQLLTVRPPD